MKNTIVGFSDALQVIPYFTSLRNEIVVRIEDEERSDLFVKLQIAMFFPPVRSVNRK